jgi:hypothetical protein
MPQKKNNPGKSKQLKMKAELIPAVIGGVLAIIAAVISIAPTLLNTTGAMIAQRKTAEVPTATLTVTRKPTPKTDFHAHALYPHVHALALRVDRQTGRAHAACP